MILALELAGAFLGGAVTMIAVLAKFGMRVGQWYLKRAMKGMTLPPLAVPGDQPTGPITGGNLTQRTP